MAKEFPTFKGITAEQKAEFKKRKYVEVFEVPLDDNLDGKGKKASFVLTKPSRNVINAMAAAATDKKLDKAQQILVANCVLGGDMIYLDEVEGDDEIYFAVITRLGELNQVKKGTVKKL